MLTLPSLLWLCRQEQSNTEHVQHVHHAGAMCHTDPIITTLTFNPVYFVLLLSSLLLLWHPHSHSFRLMSFQNWSMFFIHYSRRKNRSKQVCTVKRLSGKRSVNSFKLVNTSLSFRKMVFRLFIYPTYFVFSLHFLYSSKRVEQQKTAALAEEVGLL